MTYHSNIEKETLENKNYRKVLHTAERMQIVVMSLKPGEDIPLEVHENENQFIRIEKGNAFIEVDGEEFNLSDDDIIIIPAGAEHYVKNSSETEDLKLYTIYTPPEHPEGTIHERQEDAEHSR